MHHHRWLRHGHSADTRIHGDDERRFWSKVDASGDCWEWTGGRTDTDYGLFNVDRRMVKAYRFSYELLVGPIPDGLEIDHLCRMRHCVNPDHLEPVTRSENNRRRDLARTA